MGCNESAEAKNKISPRNEDEDDITSKIYNNHVNKKSDDHPSRSIGSADSTRLVKKQPDKIEPLKEIDVVNTVVLNHQHSQYVDLCKWNPKHDLFITASTDRKAYLWNCRVLTNAKSVDVTPIELPGHETVSCMDWSDNGKLFILGSENGRVSVWSYTGKLIHTWQAHGSSGVKAVKMSGNQDLVLSGADDVCVYSTKYQRCQITCWNGSVVTSVEWVNDETFLIAEASGMITLDKAYPDNFRKIEDYDNDDFIPDTDPLRQFTSHSAGVYKILKHPDNNDKFASCSVDCTVKLWNMANNKKDSKKKAGGGETTLTGHFGYVVDITWLDMGTRLASASYDGSVKIWDTKKAECLFTLQEGLGNVNCISCTKSGLYLASAGHDGSVYFWSLKNGGKLLHTFDGPGRIMQASFNSSDSKLVVTSYGTVIILDLSFQALPRDRSSTSSINHHDDRKNNNKQNKQKKKY